ncbi:TetR/AcrR family transcriptional regulator [Streptomyces sp. MMCC 100]|uniref:TetR/AcrR family transcriptional regulator n=1 Tax=Streptomyces sp. MMCC 100 TaxID=3163555 RepID=UPI00359ACDBF
MATRDTYRHGNLRNALIKAGVELARDGGPDAVVLREATRRVGVAPNAAYRHFADRRALLAAVSQAGLAELARTMERELAATPSPPRARLRALTRGYLAFARAQPGLFRAAFATTGMADTDTEEAAGAEGRTAYRLLSEALDDLTAAGALPPEHRPGAEYFVWSTVHGMAVLLTDGPLRGITPARAEEAERRAMDAVERGLCRTSE